MLGKNHINIAGATMIATISTGYYLSTNDILLFSQISEPIVTALAPTLSNIFLIVISIVLCLFGSLLPDVDTPTSTLGRYVHLPFEHRGFTHQIWFVIPFAIIAWFLPIVWWLVFGIISHDIVDRLSYYKIYTTGTSSETLVMAIICAVSVMWTLFCIHDVMFVVLQNPFVWAYNTIFMPIIQDVIDSIVALWTTLTEGVALLWDSFRTFCQDIF